MLLFFQREDRVVHHYVRELEKSAQTVNKVCSPSAGRINVIRAHSLTDLEAWQRG